ncbi:hypothetical protein CEXT_285831 [Caerostris extrusa]|uniref:Uncharacterized protein n=1 Tax=Caerostris extrusa TaxID=172846 RepID=A0AAV4V0E6_CAEEX|nr:hypothetical protein CEXT_285831 [Caerostris extrusa]
MKRNKNIPKKNRKRSFRGRKGVEKSERGCVPAPKTKNYKTLLSVKWSEKEIERTVKFVAINYSYFLERRGPFLVLAELSQEQFFFVSGKPPPHPFIIVILELFHPPTPKIREHGRFNTKKGNERDRENGGPAPSNAGVLNEIASAVDRIDAFGWGLCGWEFLSFWGLPTRDRESR